jgi:hypothetical protein
VNSQHAKSLGFGDLIVALVLQYSRADIRFKDGAKDDLKVKTLKLPDVDFRYAGRASGIRCHVTS